MSESFGDNLFDVFDDEPEPSQKNDISTSVVF